MTACLNESANLSDQVMPGLSEDDDAGCNVEVEADAGVSRPLIVASQESSRSADQLGRREALARARRVVRDLGWYEIWHIGQALEASGRLGGHRAAEQAA